MGEVAAEVGVTRLADGAVVGGDREPARPDVDRAGPGLADDRAAVVAAEPVVPDRRPVLADRAGRHRRREELGPAPHVAQVVVDPVVHLVLHPDSGRLGEPGVLVGVVAELEDVVVLVGEGDLEVVRSASCPGTRTGRSRCRGPGSRAAAAAAGGPSRPGLCRAPRSRRGCRRPGPGRRRSCRSLPRSGRRTSARASRAFRSRPRRRVRRLPPPARRSRGCRRRRLFRFRRWVRRVDAVGDPVDAEVGVAGRRAGRLRDGVGVAVGVGVVGRARRRRPKHPLVRLGRGGDGDEQRPARASDAPSNFDIPPTQANLQAASGASRVRDGDTSAVTPEEPRVRVALAQINPTVGDVDGNAAKVAEWIERAAGEGADLAIFPELCIPGYPAEDLYLKPHFLEAGRRAVEELAAAGRTGSPRWSASPSPPPAPPTSAAPTTRSPTSPRGRSGRSTARTASPTTGSSTSSATSSPARRPRRSRSPAPRSG